MKNHRNVCYATHAGYAEYKGLPEFVCTGCPNSPAYKSQFCSLHKLVGTSNDERSSMVIGKRVTRKGAIYEVHKMGVQYGHHSNSFLSRSELGCLASYTPSEDNMGTNLQNPN